LRDRADLNRVTGQIVDAAMTIHRDVGPGLLESVYELMMECELRDRGLFVRRQVGVQFSYRGRHFKNAFRLDLLVEERVVVELKSAARSEPVFAKQVLTYLRLLDLPVGLVINFGAPLLKQGLQRLVNDRPRNDRVKCTLFEGDVASH
jgi:GxxExxY protein